MGKSADETKGKTKARRKNPQPSRAPDCTFTQGENPPVVEPPFAAPTTTIPAAKIPQKITEAAPTPSAEVLAVVQAVSDPPTQILPLTSSMPVANLDPLHMLKQLAISMSSVGDPNILFARLAEEHRQEKASSSLKPLEIPPRTFTETTTLRAQQIPLPPPTENPKLLPLSNLPKLLHSPQPKLNFIQSSRRRRRLTAAKRRPEKQRSLTVVKGGGG